ncbi:MAG: 2,4'-dihydroxyacetophenone dioxygenase family protein [Rhodospirillales bacterium]
MDQLRDGLSAIHLDGSAAMMEIVELTARDDERLWIKEPGNAVDVWWRPLMFDIANGNHVELMKVAKGGSLGRHMHCTPVHGFVLKGSWRYIERNWVAEPGAYVYEPAGDVHSLICDHGEEMITLFHINGPIIYVDDDDAVQAIDDNKALIARARAHYAQVGLGADYVDRLFR